MADKDDKAVDEKVEEPEVEEEADAEEKPADEPEAEEPKAEDSDSPAGGGSADEPTTAGTDQQGRQLYSVKCANCGKDAQVPFKPFGDRPVYCRDCYSQKRK